MNTSIVSKKMVGAFLAVGLLVVAIAVIGALSGKKQATDKSQGDGLVQATTTRKVVEDSKLPDKFPANIPQESGAVILQNDVQTSINGRFQATRSYETSKTLAENYQIYQTYFQQNGWKITTSTNEAAYKSITATKGDLSLQVNLNDNQLTKTRTVDLYLIQITETK